MQMQGNALRHGVDGYVVIFRTQTGAFSSECIVTHTCKQCKKDAGVNTSM